ncbi:Hypothetical protein LUCI_4598 [Lucifera butyrica]|uniref:Glycosyl transferase family 9 n=1 Tax=Lucifera butyrica TaxID=1351585 RepID=A0A498RJV1_9FIRM|nr:Hypothetical protein LUCI_4598 [Lucifera butyrica]
MPKQRFFISKLGGIGDVILVTPVLQKIKDNIPDAEIVISVYGNAREVLEGLPYIDEVIVYEKSTKDLIRVVKRVWGFEYAIFFDLAYRPALMSWLAGIKKRVGITHKRKWLLTNPLEEDSVGFNKYEPYNMANILKLGAGINVTDDDLTHLNIAERSVADKEYIDHLMNQAGLTNGNFITIAPFTAFAPKDWPEENYIRLIQLLKTEYRLPIVLVGVPKNLDRAKPIEEAGGVINFVGKTSFLQMAELIHRSSIIIGSCSGHMHAAAAVGTPAVVLYGPGDPERWAPKHKCKVIYLNYSCSPCDTDGRTQTCGERPCLNNIAPELVVDATKEFLIR